MLHNYFGCRLTASNSVPKNFTLNQITVPISMHYSKNDRLADITDVNRLIPMLNGTKDLYLQQIDDFNHADFIISVNAIKILYPKILCFFEKHSPS